ncbi:MAG: cytochrome C [Chromatiales bacterium]|nr:cytochrome C [Chromatiales bacterium]
MNHKGLALSTLLGGLLVAAATPAPAGQITGSAHDFSTDAWSGGRICIACHAPHNTDTSTTDAPLWNHALSSQSYTLYSSATLDAAPLTQPGGLSKLCLSCHDGTIAVDSFGGATGSTQIAASSNLGSSLGDDHPIGFTYDTALATADGSLHDPAAHNVTIGSGGQTKSGAITDVMLYNGKMECSSCHDVHNTFTADSGTMLVKVSQAGSAICLACHDK